MNVGIHQVGQHITLNCWCRDNAGTPTLPTDVPYMEIWRGSTLIFGMQIPIVDRRRVTGLFRHKLFLSGAFTTGLYNVLYHYTVGSYAALDQDTFTIVDGGGDDGAVLAMFYYRRPHADFVVYSTDSGEIFAGKNPKV